MIIYEPCLPLELIGFHQKGSRYKMHSWGIDVKSQKYFCNTTSSSYPVNELRTRIVLLGESDKQTILF